MISKLYYRFNLANEKKIFRTTKSQYHGLVVGAHIGAYSSTWISSFLRKLSKPYFVDPMSYMFALDPPPVKDVFCIADDKESYLALSNTYNTSIQKIVQKRPLNPIDFMKEDNPDKELIRDFLKNRFIFQENIDGINPAQKRIYEYFQFDSLKNEQIIDKETEDCELEFFSIPYFYFRSLSDPWYELNQIFYKESKSIKKNKPKYSFLCFDKDILMEEDNVETLFKNYSDSEGIVLWVHDFKPRTDSEIYLNSMINFINLFAEKEIPVINLYGGYYSCLLTKIGLDGYCRSIGYGDKKQISHIAAGGGSPERFYVKEIHKSLSKNKVRSFYSKNRNLMCTCSSCKDIRVANNLKSDTITNISRFFDSIDYIEDSRAHFSNSHTTERNEIHNENLKDINVRLRKEENIAKMLNIPYFLGEDISFYERWRKSLAQYELKSNDT